MWIFYGTQSPTNFNNPLPISILDFVPSDKISLADFNNVSKTWICYDDTSPFGSDYIAPVNNMYSYADVKQALQSVNILPYTRMNIVHPKWVNNVKSYFYDGCAYTWAFDTPGTQIYYLTAYSLGNETWSYTPQVHFTHYNLNEMNKNKVIACYLVGTPGNSASGIENVRPLFGIDLSDVSEFRDHPIQYYLGPVLPKTTISEWLKGITINSPNSPTKPTGKADEVEFTSPDWNWRNQFKVMNFDELEDAADLFPEHWLIDNRFALTDTDPDYVPFSQYCVWNDSNDAQNIYHRFGYVVNSSMITSLERNINNNADELGSSIDSAFKVDDVAAGFFCTHNSSIDDFSGQGISGSYLNYSSSNMPKKITAPAFSINYEDYLLYQLADIDFSTDEYFFRLSKNYPNNTLSFKASMPSGVGDTMFFNDACIIRYEEHFYIGGMFTWGRMGNYGSSGFCILCRIDNLDQMDNYNGPNPGDPADTGDAYRKGLAASLLVKTFGPGDGSTENPSSDNVSNEYLGDAPNDDDDGSAYNADGSPRDPADDEGTGTGEKNTHPIDSEQIVNHHDGSLGNGTGDPHQGDNEISDPEDSLPSGIDDPGTVTGAGVLSVFTPTQAQLSTFTSEMLSNTVLDSIKNFFTTNPMDGIFGLHILPYTGFSSASTANPRIGTHTFTAEINLASSEYITVDYGTIFVPFSYDGYENYAPQSDAKIFLPFIGMKDIDINLIQGCYINLKYNISLVTGDIYAYLYAQWAAKWAHAGEAQGVNHLVYHWQGNCAATVPLSHLDSTNYISGAMQVAGGITSLVAGAAASNPFAIPAGISGVTNGVAEMGRTSIITSGNISGMAAFMGCREAYLLISRPIIAYNAAYRHYLGQRSNAIELIGQLPKGTFTKMRNVDLSGVMATGDELSELESILKGGFYI